MDSDVGCGNRSRATGCPSPRAGKETPDPRPTETQQGGGLVEPTRQLCRECFGALAHCLSQPLTALRGSLELALLAGGTTQEYRASLEESLRLADHLTYLIVSLRDFAEALAPSGALERVSLAALVTEAEEAFRDLAASRGLEITIESSGEVAVWGLPEQLRAAVFKLLEGAILHTPEKGVVRIALSKSASSGCLAVSNLSPSVQAGESNTGRAAPNPGSLFAQAVKSNSLDWAITQCLVEAMGGAFEVARRHNQECCLSIRLSLVKG